MIRPNAAQNLLFNGKCNPSPAHYLAALASSEPASTSLRSNIDASLGRRIRFRRVDDSLLDICRQAVKCFLNIDVALRRDLEEWDAKLVRQLLTPFRRHHPSVFPVTLVSNQDLIHAFCSMLLNV
jgi:hypothetical protein